MTPDEISKMLGAETIKKIYEDGLSKPTSELSGLITDFIKTIRLFAAPLQLTSQPVRSQRSSVVVGQSRGQPLSEPFFDSFFGRLRN